jgi:hypothetical protein
MRNILKQFFLIVIIILFSNVVNANNLDANDVRNQYNQWCSSIRLAKGDPQKIVKFYANHAILLPTLSDKILFNDHGGLNDYFAKLTSYKNIHCVTTRLIIEINGEGFATTAGFYQFIYDDKTGNRIVIPARFTFVYKKQDNTWLIIQHHSSKIPSAH